MTDPAQDRYVSMGQLVFAIWLGIVVGIPLLLGRIGYLHAVSLDIEPARRVIPYVFLGVILSGLFIVLSIYLFVMYTGGA